MERHTVRIIAFPKTLIPYTVGFYRAVEAEGITVIEGNFSGSWLRKNVKRGDWLHLHWPSFLYGSKGGRCSLMMVFIRFLLLLLFARFLGARIIWTAHNLLPHDRSLLPGSDLVGRYVVIILADIVLVHGENAIASLVARYPLAKNKIVAIPHGHWIDYYPASMTREIARSRLGISGSKFVFLFIGLCKSYKNLDGLIRTFQELSGDSLLVVAGKFQDPLYQEEILALAHGNPRIRIEPGFVPDGEMQSYLMACDAVVVPYREILTSGTAILALSFGRPIVSVALGFLKDIVTGETGILFPPDDADGLSNALREASARSFNREHILKHAESFTFAEAARRLVKTMREKSHPVL